MRAYASAVEQSSGVPVMDVNARKTIPGSFDALCVAYYRSSDFSNLEDSTREVVAASWRSFAPTMARSRSPSSPACRSASSSSTSAAGRRFPTTRRSPAVPRSANNLLKALRTMLTFAVGVGMLETNPAEAVKLNKAGKGNHVWSEDEIAQFEAKHAVGTRQRLAFDLLLYTSQRAGDVARMGWQNVADDCIAVVQQSTSTKL